MKFKNIVLPISLILNIALVAIIAANVISAKKPKKDPSLISQIDELLNRVASPDEDLSFDEEISYKATEELIQIREYIITRLIDIVKQNPVNVCDDDIGDSSKANAIRVLGEFRAKEAAAIILDNLYYYYYINDPEPSYSDEALVNIGMPAINEVMNRISEKPLSDIIKHTLPAKYEYEGDREYTEKNLEAIKNESVINDVTWIFRDILDDYHRLVLDMEFDDALGKLNEIKRDNLLLIIRESYGRYYNLPDKYKQYLDK